MEVQSVEYDLPQNETEPDDSSGEQNGTRKRKKRADAGKPRGPRSGGASKGPRTGTKAHKASVWLTQQEAEYLTFGLWGFFMTRYGALMQGVIYQPDDASVKHLAALLRKLEEVFPPFRFLQRIIGRIIPMANPDAKPGGSPFGDLVQYAYGWHKANPGDEIRPALAEAIYHYDPAVPEIPFYPKQPEGVAPVVTETRTMTPEEYNAFMRHGGFDGTA